MHMWSETAIALIGPTDIQNPNKDMAPSPIVAFGGLCHLFQIGRMRRLIILFLYSHLPLHLSLICCEPYPLGRIDRDALGRANQQLAKNSDRLIMMVAGIPVTIP